MKPNYIRSVDNRGTYCSGCHAQIVWAITTSGKKMPLDADTLNPHWATCPVAKQFKQR
jgi:hypothetical protein